jgi:hypothetical protein
MVIGNWRDFDPLPFTTCLNPSFRSTYILSNLSGHGFEDEGDEGDEEAEGFSVHRGGKNLPNTQYPIPLICG